MIHKYIGIIYQIAQYLKLNLQIVFYILLEYYKTHILWHWFLHA